MPRECTRAEEASGHGACRGGDSERRPRAGEAAPREGLGAGGPACRAELVQRVRERRRGGRRRKERRGKRKKKKKVKKKNGERERELSAGFAAAVGHARAVAFGRSAMSTRNERKGKGIGQRLVLMSGRRIAGI
jgi:hypothetical protein